MLVGELCGCWALAELAARNIANRAKLVLLKSVAPIAISQGLAAYRLPAPIKRWGSVQPVRSVA